MDATGPQDADRLRAYRAKRALGITPEPAGAAGTPDGHLFVMHKHAASHLHWDLRLQMEGVLRSWAVPKGPSANPDDKRLAVLVEDHPLEYADFEGIIPEGNYGAGAVIVWDRGEWVPLEDPVAGLAKGKLLFDLRGYKLRGRWTLVKIKKSDREWLLIKERDALVRDPGTDFPESSVLSGLTVEQLKSGHDRAADVRQRIADLGAHEGTVTAEAGHLMLAETCAEPFDREGWLFEIKYDGYRMLAEAGAGSSRLVSRNENDFTTSFPELARALRALPCGHVVLDGEVVVHDQAGLPSFQRLQKRARLTRGPDVRRAAVELPATLYVFDILGFEGWDLRELPLQDRKSLVRELLPPVGPLRYADHIEQTGGAFFAQAVEMGLEGIVGKRADAPYRAGRSPHWQKVRADLTDDFVVVGFTAPKGSREGFGALHVAWYADDTLVYAGRVGTGFRSEDLTAVRDTLEGMVVDAAPCTGAPTGQEHRWTEPAMVVEVRYKEVTEEGLLRQPVFVRFRDDKPPEDCLRRAGGDASPTTVPVVRPARVEVILSNVDKVFWPEEGYTKGDLIAYYRAVAPWMLPYLADRPLVMTRYPDGIDGKSFFQKDAPVFAPDWIRTEVVYSDDAEREIRYFVADDVDALAYVANLGTIPLHVWASRIATLEQPDWAIIDLDPKEAPFADVVTVALAARRLSEAIGWPCFIKTSGSTGLHVLLPLGRRCTHEQARQLAELLALVLVRELPEIATTRRLPTQREGKVYLDFLQNGRGKLLVAPFSVRPLPGAPVSTPLDWDEVVPDLDIRQFTIRTVPERLASGREDPLHEVLDAQIDLADVLGQLQRHLAG
ncbi:MAG: DNA ligase D [Gemmatimonadota bacterium]|nr:DNA ligase D [Gemmatimonadota bacterium]MDH5196655.1 DNA ligase D [Gemmatimonadota bacterium]